MNTKFVSVFTSNLCFPREEDKNLPPDLEEGEIRDDDEPEENEAANDSTPPLQNPTCDNPIPATFPRSVGGRFQEDLIDNSVESAPNNSSPSQNSSVNQGPLSVGGRSLEDLIPIQNSFLDLFIQLKPESSNVDRVVKFILDQVPILQPFCLCSKTQDRLVREAKISNTI